MHSKQLKSLPLLESLDQDTFDAILPQLVQRHVKAGTYLCQCGDPSDDIYIVAEGQTEVLLPVDGDDLLLSVVPAPTFLGLMGVLEDAPRTAAIRAGTDLELVLFPKRVLAALDARGSGQLERFYRDALIYQARDLRSANSRVSHHYREKLAALGAAIDRIQELYDQTLSLARARERIVNHVSHELKTPLAIMAGSLRVVSELLGGSEMAQRVLGRFQRNLQRLHDIQRSMMDIYEAKVATQGFELPIESVPVLGLLRQIMNVAKSEAHDRNVEVLLDAPSNLAADVPLRPFGEALEGLIRNALENTPDESRIVVTAHAEEGDVLTVTIHDHGVGIAAENLKHIFEGFFHTQETDRYSSKRPYAFDAGGKGLDLLKIRSYTDRYGWDLEVESERCRFIPTDSHVCPGRVSACGACTTRDDCLANGRTTFKLMVPQTMAGERSYEPRTSVREMRRVQRTP